jgi:hypothetical protein
MNLFVLFVDGVSIRKKKDGNLASCATRNDAVSRHFFFYMDTFIYKQNNKSIPYLRERKFREVSENVIENFSNREPHIPCSPTVMKKTDRENY